MKFADTPNQRYNRLQRQKQSKLCTEISDSSSIPCELPKNQTITYQMELLQDYPPLSIPTKYSQTLQDCGYCHYSLPSFWIDFSLSSNFENDITNLLYSNRLCSMEDIIESSSYQSSTTINCVRFLDFY